MPMPELDPLEDVRIQVRHLLPALSHFFHLHPWDVERLPRAELDVYLKELQAIQAAQRD